LAVLHAWPPIASLPAGLTLVGLVAFGVLTDPEFSRQKDRAISVSYLLGSAA
jgi:hypothetical protein